MGVKEVNKNLAAWNVLGRIIISPRKVQTDADGGAGTLGFALDTTTTSYP